MAMIKDKSTSISWTPGWTPAPIPAVASNRFATTHQNISVNQPYNPNHHYTAREIQAAAKAQAATTTSKNIPSWVSGARSNTTTGLPTKKKDGPGTPAAKVKSSGSGVDDKLAAKNKKAAANLALISKYNAKTAMDEFDAARAGYDQADQQNRQSAEVQKKQNSRTSSNDRFAQLLKLQSSASDIIGGAGNAIQGSQAGNLSGMLRRRNNMDSSESLSTLTTNQNAVINALNDALSANAIARNEAAMSVERALRGIEADYAAQLNTIDPSLFIEPGKGKAALGSAGFADSRKVTPQMAQLAGYITSAPSSSPVATTQANTGSSYFDQLMNGYNRR